MQDQMKNLPVFRKVLLFSFIISFFVVLLTGGISFFLQTKQMEEQLRNRIVEMATLWSSQIDHEEIEQVKEKQDSTHPAFQSLFETISLVNEKAPFSDAYILAPEIVNESDVYILVSSKSFEKLGMKSLTYYEQNKAFLKGYKEVLQNKDVTTTHLYRGVLGLWITAFVPMTDANGNVAAVFCLDINASLLDKFQKEIGLYLIVLFVIIITIVYFILKNGLRKVLNPVNEIISGFNEVSSGNFNIKLDSASQADLGVLFERFNFMTTNLSLLFEHLSATSEQFGTVPKNIGSLHRFEEAIDEMEQILQISKIQRELQRAEKMNAIGQLAASVAHEIRNPMTVVKGFLQIFLAKEEISEEEQMYIKLMINELNRAETIINDYLSLAKPDIEQTEMIDAGEMASKVLDLMNSYAMMTNNILLVSDLQDNVFLDGNSGELRQVLINILKNGIEAMKDGGTLTLLVYQEEQYGVFEIQDTGIGMSEEELERLGTAFYSLKEKGTGIGMMVCYQIIDRMKGKIEVTSKMGAGTTFKVYVPLREE
ncbi:ATP-binding protein [Sporosarcina sp. HYO08]|uniref:ATP-binding protein n=1 Tax=Sporosarcina sp. HYO08 TaxID=1759557 RepID=UPI00079C0DE5|nr:ATP-binding protein [Sporosarcina sp. HYO08]KXH86111.1 hypothetical protein AU377_14690 [Sporosarcina sp. HYO08]